MNKKKNRIIKSSILGLFFVMNGLFAQDITTVTALSDDISNNLDLEAVASVFGDSKDLEDFEKRLNDPKTQISNLDLNEGNNVDYLRVIETVESNTHVIAIQAVLDENIYQDIANIEVEKDTEGNTSVQVVGDVYMYGSNYIIEPVYIHRPLFFSVFWRPFYRPFKSVYYWGYYPKHFHFWHPHSIHTYRKNVHIHINVRHRYTHTHVRKSTRAVHIHSKVRRNDFAKKHPHKSYNTRVVGVNKTNGIKKRDAGVNKANGTKKRVVGVNKANGTKKRVYAVKKPNGNKKVIATKSKSKTKKTHKRKKKAKKKKGKKKKRK